mmetsp:Transcript_19746/g.50076  ORF Transcript_19746/g.50076 Transcript_19746/m.50076 type:complete len:268 (-) Transcript_19746:188-991(-)
MYQNRPCLGERHDHGVNHNLGLLAATPVDAVVSHVPLVRRVSDGDAPCSLAPVDVQVLEGHRPRRIHGATAVRDEDGGPRPHSTIGVGGENKQVRHTGGHRAPGVEGMGHVGPGGGELGDLTLRVAAFCPEEVVRVDIGFFHRHGDGDGTANLFNVPISIVEFDRLGGKQRNSCVPQRNIHPSFHLSVWVHGKHKQMGGTGGQRRVLWKLMSDKTTSFHHIDNKRPCWKLLCSFTAPVKCISNHISFVERRRHGDGTPELSLVNVLV